MYSLRHHSHIKPGFQYIESNEAGSRSGSVPASWFPGHPKNWGEELARIELSAEGVSYVSLSDDDRLLAIAVGPNIHLYTVDIDWEAGSLDPRIQLRLKRIFRFGSDRNAKIEFVGIRSSPEGKMMVSSGSQREGRIQFKYTVQLWFIDADDSDSEEKDPIAEAAEAASRAASQVLRNFWSEETSTRQNLTQVFEKALRVVQLQAEINPGVVFQGHFGRFESWPFNHHDEASLLIFSSSPDLFISVVSATRNGFQERFRLVGHTDNIVWAEFSPNDRVIGTSSWDQTVRIWDAEDGKLIHTLTGATSQCWGAAFSPDCKLLAAGEGEGRVQLWNIESGELIHAFEGYNHSGWVRSLAFSPDGKMLAAGSGMGILRIFDVSRGECMQYWRADKPSDEAWNVQYTVNGVLVFKTTNGSIFTFDPKTGQKGRFEHGEYAAPSGKNCVTLHDGRLLFTADSDDSVRIWRLE